MGDTTFVNKLMVPEPSLGDWLKTQGMRSAEEVRMGRETVYGTRKDFAFSCISVSFHLYLIRFVTINPPNDPHDNSLDCSPYQLSIPYFRSTK